MFNATTHPLWDLNEDSPGLLQLVAKGEIVVPKFQRPYVWDQKRAVSLVHSIARGWPSGTLLMSDDPSLFPVGPLKYVDEVAPKDNLVYSVLDGQQRLTALNAVYNGLIGGHTHFVDLKSMLDRPNQEPLEDDFQYLSNGKYRDRFGEDEEGEAQNGIIPIKKLVKSAAWNSWLDHVDDSGLKEQYVNLREERLGGLLNYVFPVQAISKQAPLEVLTNVFVTINQQGMVLEAFDLMVARTWRDVQQDPPNGYDMRAIWEQMAVGDDENPPSSPRLENYGVHPTTPLKVCQILITGKEAQVTNGKILKLPPDEVRSRFQSACVALDKAIELLEANASLVPETLASENYLIPIAVAVEQFMGGNPNQEQLDQIVEWYWAAAFSQRYGRGGTGSKLAPDALELRHWLDDSGASVPVIVRDFWTDKRNGFGVNDLVEVASMNEHLLSAILGLQTDLGAVDWEPGDPKTIAALGKQRWPGDKKPKSVLHSHHIFPCGNALPGREVVDIEVSVIDPQVGGDPATMKLKLPSKEEAAEAVGADDEEETDSAVELVVNRALIHWETNNKISNLPLETVLSTGKADAEHVATHLVPTDEEVIQSWPNFVGRRVEAIFDAVTSKVRAPDRD